MSLYIFIYAYIYIICISQSDQPQNFGLIRKYPKITIKIVLLSNENKLGVFCICNYFIKCNPSFLKKKKKKKFKSDICQFLKQVVFCCCCLFFFKNIIKLYHTNKFLICLIFLVYICKCVNIKMIVLNNLIPYHMHSVGVRAAPLWDSATQSFVGKSSFHINFWLWHEFSIVKHCIVSFTVKWFIDPIHFSAI